MCLVYMTIPTTTCGHTVTNKDRKAVPVFIKRVDQQKYDNNIKQIFLVLDNLSIHKSNKVKETLSRYHPRIQLIFLPTRPPDLNLIEVR